MESKPNDFTKKPLSAKENGFLELMRLLGIDPSKAHSR